MKWIIVLAVIVVGVLIAWNSSRQTDECIFECGQDSFMIEEANRTGHGIDHTCYDYCIGGSTEPRWEWYNIFT